MMKKAICRLFGHKWVDVCERGDNSGVVCIGMCYRCDELRQYSLSQFLSSGARFYMMSDQERYEWFAVCVRSMGKEPIPYKKWAKFKYQVTHWPSLYGTPRLFRFWITAKLHMLLDHHRFGCELEKLR